MIEGLKFDVKSEELKKHLEERCNFHKERAAFYRKQEEEFKKNATDAEIREGQNTMKQTHQAMKDSARVHEGQHERYTYLAAHLIPDETYRLSEKDLHDLECFGALTRHYWPY